MFGTLSPSRPSDPGPRPPHPILRAAYDAFRLSGHVESQAAHDHACELTPAFTVV